MYASNLRGYRWCHDLLTPVSSSPSLELGISPYYLENMPQVYIYITW
jgi:hypothetical protein